MQQAEIQAVHNGASAAPEEWNGKGAGGIYIKDGALVMLDRKGREIGTIYRSSKELAPPPVRNTSREAARRLRQQQRLEAKRRTHGEAIAIH